MFLQRLLFGRNGEIEALASHPFIQNGVVYADSAF